MGSVCFNKSSVNFHLFCQDANECWLQMMRVLQQKLETLEPETAMEVNLYLIMDQKVAVGFCAFPLFLLIFNLSCQPLD